MSETIPVKMNHHALRIGWYADKYFLRTQEILSKDFYDHKVHYQYFPRKDVILCGVNHVREIFKKCIGYYKDREKAWSMFQNLQAINPYEPDKTNHNIYNLNDWLDSLWVDKSDEVEIYMAREGTEIKSMEPVIGLIGNPKYFAHLETPTLGILAQQSAVATSVSDVVKMLNSNQSLLFFPARFRHYVINQASDGYAAVVGGSKFLSTDSNGEYLGYSEIETIPHLLIAAYGGNTALAALKFDEYIDSNIDRVILVDWKNDCIGTTLQVLSAYLIKSLCWSGKEEIINDPISSRHFIRDHSHMIKDVIGKGKGKVFGVRFDTSGNLVDKTFAYESYKGVCPELVKKARYEFDELGLQDLKIIVSGGFDIEKIEKFQNLNTPVDSYGIWSSIVNNFTVDFTADAVTLDGKSNAKIGRELKDWSKMTHII